MTVNKKQLEEDGALGYTLRAVAGPIVGVAALGEMAVRGRAEAPTALKMSDAAAGIGKEISNRLKAIDVGAKLKIVDEETGRTIAISGGTDGTKIEATQKVAEARLGDTTVTAEVYVRKSDGNH